jgi:hypothetical protein
MQGAFVQLACEVRAATHFRRASLLQERASRVVGAPDESQSRRIAARGSERTRGFHA